jgi:hypothetical protein
MGRESHEKREREKKRKARAAEKRQRREEGPEPGAEPAAATDDAVLLERFRVLSEQHASGAIDAAAYDAERKSIFAELGLADPLGD